jgi:hypothetical protein
MSKEVSQKGIMCSPDTAQHGTQSGMKRLHLYAYKVQIIQTLQPSDYDMKQQSGFQMSEHSTYWVM